MEFLVWLKGSPVSNWVLASAWANPTLLCMHAIGMALVVGSGLMTNLRVLGYARPIPVTFFSGLFGIAWTGVALNAVSGLLLFSSNGDKYIANWTFQLKIALILGAGLVTWMMWRVLSQGPVVGGTRQISTAARVAALTSTVFWIGAVTAGRMIAYTMNPPGF